MASPGTAATPDWTPKVADACWFGLALLHREQPNTEGFPAADIAARIASEWPGPQRAGIQPHIYLHCVAGLPPNAAQYRMFTKVGDRYRLFRDGDDFHPQRAGKTKPEDDPRMPAKYREILRWYSREFNRGGGGSEDPVMAMAGVGAELWRKAGGTAFVDRLRDSWNDAIAVEDLVDFAPSRTANADAAAAAWERVCGHQGEVFHTVENLPFTFEVEGKGLWFHREGRRINRKLPYSHFERAVERCPLSKTTEISDLLDPSYLFALLTDERIRGDW